MLDCVRKLQPQLLRQLLHVIGTFYHATHGHVQLMIADGMQGLKVR